MPHLRPGSAGSTQCVDAASDRRPAHVLQTLIERYDVSGNLVPDAHLAALAIQHGLTVCSADTDLARFSEIRWENPLADGG